MPSVSELSVIDWCSAPPCSRAAVLPMTSPSRVTVTTWLAVTWSRLWFTML